MATTAAAVQNPAAAAAAAAAAAGASLQVAISPEDGLLVFPLAGGSSREVAAECSAVVTITNNSSTAPAVVAAYKILTTNPRRYLVRPSQGLLRPGERHEVRIAIPPAKQAELMQGAAAAAAAGGDSERGGDKFQVLCVGLDKATADALLVGRVSGVEHEALSRLWADADRQRRALERRFDVHFSRSLPATPSFQSPKTAASPSRPPPASSSSSSLVSVGPTPTTVAEYRKRYDELVTLTVSLTTERGALLNALDTLKLEVRRELAAAAQLEHGGGHGAAGGVFKQDQLSQHKRRRSKASSAALRSSIPAIAAHIKEPSTTAAASSLMGPTGADGPFRKGSDVVGAAGRQQQQQQQQRQEQWRGRGRYSLATMVVMAAVAFAMGRAWAT